MSTKRFFNKKGASLFEVMIALIILSVLTMSVGVGMSKQRRWGRDGQNRAIAQILAKNEIEALRAAGPENAAAYVGTRTVNSAGETVADGDFEISVSNAILCEGGEKLPDNLDPSIIAGGNVCLGRKAILSYDIRIKFPGQDGRDELTFDLKLGELDRYGEVKGQL